MIEFNYLREKRRMLDSLGRTSDGCTDVSCDECFLSPHNNNFGCGCEYFEMEHPDEATAIVRKWSEEHPVKTRADYMMECFPSLSKEKAYELCWEQLIGVEVDCTGMKCDECMRMPFEGWGDSGHD